MILYKYIEAKWGISILTDLRLKVTPPNEFNDPFEFTPQAVNPIESQDPIMLARLNESLRTEGLDSSVETLKKILPVLKKNNSIVKDLPAKLAQADLAARDVASGYFGVLCLSEHETDIRMWAHYGDQNRGVVVGLDFNKEEAGIDGVV